MHIGELTTCVEIGLPIVFAVINDGRWNMVHHGFERIFGRTVPSFPSNVVDLAAVARGFGAVGIRIDAPHDLERADLKKLSTLGRPVVLDIRIDPGLPLSTHSRVASVSQFVRKS